MKKRWVVVAHLKPEYESHTANLVLLAMNPQSEHWTKWGALSAVADWQAMPIGQMYTFEARKR